MRTPAQTLTMQIQNQIYCHMENNHITQWEVAKRMGKTQSYVSQLLGPERKNLTLKTLVELAGAAGCVLEVKVVARA